MYDDISGNAEQFARSLEAFAEQTEKDVNTIIRKALMDLMTAIIIGGGGSDGTPRETQRARMSWMIDTEWADAAFPPGDYTGVDMSSHIAEMLNSLPKSDRYVIFNNLEYIIPLENGHSQQAPSGFVAQALAAMGEYFAKAARSLGYEGTL